MKLPTVGLISVRDHKLLLAYSKNKRAWYLPGGKVDQGESFESALAREIKEELSVDIELSETKYYCHITAQAYGEPEGIIMEQECYLYPLNEYKASHEIGEVRYFSYSDYLKEAVQVVGVLMVYENLLQDKLI